MILGEWQADTSSRAPVGDDEPSLTSGSRVGSEARLYPAGSLRFALINELVFILDLSTEEYFALNEISSEFWQAIVAHGGDRMLAQTALLRRHPSQPGAISSAFRTFLQDCVKRGFLCTSPAREESVPQRARGASSPVRYALTWRAWWSMMVTWVHLKTRGFGPTYVTCYARSRPPPSAAIACVQRAIDSFVFAENFIWFDNAPKDCLPRSLALFRFLRSVDIPAVHRIGGRRFPGFMMHAWVELNDVPLLDDRLLISEYTIIASIS